MNIVCACVWIYEFKEFTRHKYRTYLCPISFHIETKRFHELRPFSYQRVATCSLVHVASAHSLCIGLNEDFGWTVASQISISFPLGILNHSKKASLQ